MKKIRKYVALIGCLMVFAALALGSGSDTSGGDKNISSDKKSTEKVVIDEQELVNQDGIKITAKEYVTDSIWGEGIKVLIENDTSVDITVGCRALIVNDYMITDLFSESVSAGKKSNETIYLSSDALKAAGIETVGQIEVYFYVYETESWDEMFETDCVTIKTSAYEIGRAHV